MQYIIKYGIWIYLIIINIVGFSLMYIDKVKSIKKKWRIKESTLISVAILGGSIGALMGMELFRHKTKHAKFKYGIPIILISQAVMCLIILYIK